MSTPRVPAARRGRVLHMDAQIGPRQPLLLDAPLGLWVVRDCIRRHCIQGDCRILDGRTVHGGDRPEACAALLMDFRPAIVGISSFSRTMPVSLVMAATVRRSDPSAPVFLGGYRATASPEGRAKYGVFDLYVRGEGVRFGAPLVRGLLDGRPAIDEIPSLSHRKGGSAEATPAQSGVDNERAHGGRLRAFRSARVVRDTRHGTELFSSDFNRLIDNPIRARRVRFLSLLNEMRGGPARSWAPRSRPTNSTGISSTA